MSRQRIVALSAVGCLLVAPLGASGQPLDLTAPAPERPRDNDIYPHRPQPVPPAPGFVAPFSKETETGRAGVAGWTAPNTPVGSRGAADLGRPGWLGFGFAVEWGRPARRTRAN